MSVIAETKQEEALLSLVTVDTCNNFTFKKKKKKKRNSADKEEW